jgi:hypothetical protein
MGGFQSIDTPFQKRQGFWNGLQLGLKSIGDGGEVWL